MTIKECVGHLKKLKLGIVYINNLVPNEADKDKIDLEALDLAIKALEERPTGEWARHDEWVGGVYVGGFYHVNCSCEDGYYSKWETNFCPNCGAEMRKEAENDT